MAVINGTVAGEALNGTNDPDTINGAEGNDTIRGSGGNDLIHGDEDDDTLFGDEGNDVVHGDDGGDSVNGGGGADILYGGAGNDAIRGDYEYGNGGSSAYSNDIMYGGDGDDYFREANVTSSLKPFANGFRYDGNGDLMPTWQYDEYYGENGNDWINGAVGHVVVDGGADNDLVDLWSSFGSATGGSGTDSVSFASSGEAWAIDSLPGRTDPVTYTIDLSAMWSGGTGSITSSYGTSMSLTSFETLLSINTTWSLNAIERGGDDTVIIGAGYTGMIGTASRAGAGIVTGLGNDYVEGGSGIDVIRTGLDDDEVHGGGGNDIVYLDEGADEAHGGTGDDTLYGDDGDDALYGDDGNDTLNVGKGGNLADGGAGDDTIYGGRETGGYAPLDARSHTDVVRGGSGNDTISDFFGVVDIDGGADDDNVVISTIVGTVAGGTGFDAFRIDLSWEFYITGVVPDITLDLSAMWARGTGHLNTMTISGFESFQGFSSLDGNDTIIIGESYTLDVGYFSGGIAGPFSANAGISGGGGNDTIVAGAGNDCIAGNDGNDVLDGGTGRDMMVGGAGNDVFYVDYWQDSGTGYGYAADIVSEAAGGGTDTVYARASFGLDANSNAAEIELLEAADIAGTQALDLRGNFWGQTIRGNAGVNQLYGKEGDDTLHGLGGNDTLIGGSGNDTMVGGLGDDVYFVQDAGDTIVEFQGEGSDRLIAYVSYVLPSDVSVEIIETETYTGTAAIDLAGNAAANTILGNNGANVFDGAAGDDTLHGFAGNDYLYGATGVDNMYGGAGDDAFYMAFNDGDRVWEFAGEGYDVVSTEVDYTLPDVSGVERLEAGTLTATSALYLGGSNLDNLIIGNAGNNTLRGFAGADTLHGLGGDDALIGDDGADVMYGGTGNDTYYVGTSDDRIFENAGEGSADRAAVDVSYALPDESEIETLEAVNSGATAAMDLTGSSYANLIVGNAGANVIDGKGGNDVLVGLGGADTFAFTTALGAGNVDRIEGFVAGTDHIALDDAILADLSPGSMDANRFVVGSAAGDADDRVIYDSATGALWFDADGNGAGAAVQIAWLSGNPALGASDFLII